MVYFMDPERDSFDAMTHPLVFVSSQRIMIGDMSKAFVCKAKNGKKSSVPPEWRNKTWALHPLTSGYEICSLLLCLSVDSNRFPWSSLICVDAPPSLPYNLYLSRCVLHAYTLLSFSTFIEKSKLHELINSLFPHKLHFLCHHFKLLCFVLFCFLFQGE